MWNSWLVLSACAVITQSLPRPDGAYNIPTVPAGKRVQYYVLHDDGAYKYGFDTGAGAFETAVKMGNEQTGSFGFNNAEGKKVRVDYTAGVGGFQPTSSSFTPEKPEILVEVPQPVVYSASVSDPEQPGRDASYSFSYKTDDSHRREASDSDLNVDGEYSFVDPDGIRRQINYRAGSATGFVVEGSHLPVAEAVPAVFPVVPAVPVSYSASVVPVATKYSADAASTADITNQLNEDGSYKFSYDALSSSRSETADSDLNVKGSYSFKTDDGHRRTINYIAGSATGFVAEGADIPVAPEVAPAVLVAPVPLVYSASPVPVATKYSAEAASTADITNQLNEDGSYKFSYDALSSSRSETADSDLNVKGSYSFKTDDGHRRTINYIAGSATGYVAEGADIPVETNVVPVLYSAPESKPVEVKPTVVTLYTVPETSEIRNDASYDFRYNNRDSSRFEESDSDLNVKGKYEYTGDDGVHRTVRYRAGSGIGFVAETSEVGTPNTLYDASALSRGTLNNVKFRSTDESKTTQKLYVPITYTAAATSGNDGSYAFSYDAGSSDREESADNNLNVRGKYSFIAEDGVRRRINYIAGSKTGFVAEGDISPVVAEVEPVVTVEAAVNPTVYTAESASDDVTASADRLDSSYKFGYTNDDSDREESADANLNVKGSFSFIADDGERKTVKYKAGSATGFIADGTHLPVAHDLPSAAPHSSVAGHRSSASLSSSAVLFKSAAVTPAVVSINEKAANKDLTSNTDGSYTFGYKNSDSERSETADSDLNVRGHFSFQGDDGETKKVTYKAGSSTGFVVVGNHLPIAPLVDSSANKATLNVTPLLKSAAPVVPAAVEINAENNGDSSYSFKYSNSDSSRDESADSALNVKGSFKFVADDGLERTVKYIAGSETGFVAEGTHLPKVGVIPVVPVEIPSTRSAVAQSSHTSTSNADTVNLSNRGSFSETYFRSAASHPSHDESIVGNVLLRQYRVMPGKTKFGYVFTEV